MAEKKKIFIFSGLVLIVVGFLSALTALFYEFKVKPEMMARRGGAVSSMSVQSSHEIPAKPHGIGVDVLMNYSKDLYDSDESNRREGTLWVDQAGNKLVVNLGALNGLKSQDQLMVYDRDHPIGQVQVVSVFDVVSYVEKKGSFDESVGKDYYRVEKE